VLAGLVLLLAVAAAIWALGSPHERSFDRRARSDAEEIIEGGRVAMAERLVAERTLVGMTHDQVLTQLGPRSYVESMGPCFSRWQLVYFLAPPLSGRSRYLGLRFSDAARVVEAAIESSHD
jgi:hypothetical protein